MVEHDEPLTNPPRKGPSLYKAEKMNDLSPNAMWEKLGCTVERTNPNPNRPHVALRTVKDSFGRVVSCHTSSNAGYDYEHSVASWLLSGGM